MESKNNQDKDKTSSKPSIVPRAIDRSFKFARLDKAIKPGKLKTSYIQSDINKPIQRSLNRSQVMLNELVGGTNQLWGTGQDLPKVNEGQGIDRNDNGGTGRLFGFRR